MANGVKTDDLPPLTTVLELIGNGEAGVGRIAIEFLAAIIMQSIPGPHYETNAELVADLDWDADGIAAVWGDASEALNGVYKKSGASGAGAWTRIGDLPMAAATQAALALKANLANPSLTGTPTAPTAASGTNTDQIATTAFIQAALDALTDAAPVVLDTLKELATALGDDPNFATTMATALAAKAPSANPSLTGTPTAPTAAPGTNTDQIATTEFLAAALAALLDSATEDGNTLGKLESLLSAKANEDALGGAYAAGSAFDLGRTPANSQLWAAGSQLAILAGVFKGGHGVGWDQMGRVVATGVDVRQSRSYQALKPNQEMYTADGKPILTHDRNGRVRAPYGQFLDVRRGLSGLADHEPLLTAKQGGKEVSLFGITPQGLDVILAPRAVARMQSAMRPLTLLGAPRAHQIGPVEQDDTARYTTVSIPGGPTSRIKQLKDGDRETAIPVSDDPIIHLEDEGQSNAGPVSGFNAPEPLTGYMARDIALTIENGTTNCTEGSIVQDGSEAPDLISATEPVVPSNGQNPVHLKLFAFVRLLEQMGLPNPGVVGTAAFKGGTAWDELYRETTTNTIHENAVGQATAVRRLAAEYGRSVQTGIHLTIGEAGPDGEGEVLAAYQSLRADEFPEVGGGALPPVFINQINFAADAAKEPGSALDLVTIARTYPNEAYLVGPMYDAPVIGPAEDPPDNIHCSPYGRMIWTQRDALATICVQVLGIGWNPLWPVAGGVTRAGAVINVPLELPPIATFDQVRLNNDWVPAVQDRGFVVKYNDAVQTISDIALDHTNKSLVITLASDPGPAATGELRYALDNLSPHSYFAGGRGPVHVATGLRSPFAMAGHPIPSEIQLPMVRFKESFS